MKDEKKTNKQLIHELEELQHRVTELELQQDMSEPAQGRIDHLNRVLRAIRNVNQLIVREKDRGRLLEGACESFVSHHGYFSAWIVLLDESGRLTASAEKGTSDGFQTILKRFRNGKLTKCAEKTLLNPEVITFSNPETECMGCSLSDHYTGRGSMVVRLEHDAKVYGILAVSVPSGVIDNPEEKSLLREVAGDLSYALHSIELNEVRLRGEEERKRLLHDLEERVKELDCLYRITTSLRTRNTLAEILQDTANNLPPGWHYPEITRAKVIYGDDVYVSEPFDDTEWMQSSDIIVIGEQRGTVEVYYLEERPLLDEGPFLKEERALIDNIAHMLNETVERKLIEERFHQSQKMEAIGLLAGGIAHDFNNILQAIVGYADLAKAGLAEDDSRFDDISEIRNCADRAAELTRQLLAFGRRQVLELKDIDLNDLTKGLLRMLRRVIGEDIVLDCILGHRLGIIHADPGQMGQVILNLCVNARDAMPNGGHLTIETENVRITEEYCRTHVWAQQGHFILLTVTDTGMGMSEETCSKIFEPFFTTKDVSKGTGLGLSTVYGIVHQHDGFINVYSEVGKGTMFKIYLPLVERHAEEIDSIVLGEVTGGTETILVAEDDEAIRRLAKRVFERAGYTVLLVKDGPDALLVLNKHADCISLALLDVVMPGASGKDVYDAIRSINPDIRVLFTSGYSDNAIHTRFVLDEGLRLIRKPYDSDTLLREVRAVLDE